MDRRVDGRREVQAKVQGFSILNRTSSTVTRRSTKKTPSATSSSSTKNLPACALIPCDTRAEESDNSEGEFTKSSARRGERPTKKFACPFFKHDPIKYGTQDRRRCAGTGWPDISRLKEHLTRSHTSPIYCPKCYEEFTDLQGSYEHSTADCAPRSGRPPDGITPEMSRKLRSRKKTTPLQSDHDKWVEIYRILFPCRRHVPSPYFEPPQGKVLVHLDGQEEYMRREVRRLIKSRLELKDGGSDKSELLKIVDECQDEAFNKYRRLSGFDFHDDAGVYTTSTGITTAQVPQLIPCDSQTLSSTDVSGLQPEDETTTQHKCICGSSTAGGEACRNCLLVKEEHFPDIGVNMVTWSDWLNFDNDPYDPSSKNTLILN